MKKENFRELSPKVKMALLSLIDEFYSIDKQHTVVVMPFFGLLHSQGNESKPFLNYVDINILDLMKSQFKGVVVYPGENNYLSSYGLPSSAIEHLANEQNILSRIVNKTTSFDKISDRHREILYLYEKAIADFDRMKEKYPLPYKTAFDIQSPEDLVSYIKKVNHKIKQEDKENKICLVCPLSFVADQNSTYDEVVELIKSTGVMLYFAGNHSDRYLTTTDYRMLYDEEHSERFIQSIQDFANTYNEDISSRARKELQFDRLLNQIKNGELGSSDNQIIENLEQINVKDLFSSQPEERTL